MTSIVITQEPSSGTVTVNDDGTIDYQHDDSDDPLEDSFTYTIQDNDGATSEEVTVTITIVDRPEVENDVISSNSSDPIYRRWRITGIEEYPESRTQIFNRWGNKVWDVVGYDNDSKFFEGRGDGSGLGGARKTLPIGTYFYVIDLKDGSEPIKGYIHVE